MLDVGSSMANKLNACFVPVALFLKEGMQVSEILEFFVFAACTWHDVLLRF